MDLYVDGFRAYGGGVEIPSGLSGESRSSDVAGTRVHYRFAGAGDPVVLLHGWPTTLELWREQIPLLAQHHRVYALDLPGFGSSARPAGRYSFGLLAEVVVGFLDCLGLDRVSLVGHDLGGPIALLVAIRHPARVNRLVVLNTTPYPELPPMVRPLLFVARNRMLSKLLTTRLTFRLLFRIGTAKRREIADGLAARYFGPLRDDHEARRALRAVLADTNPSELSAIEHGAAGLICPVLVLWGDKDPTAPMGIARRLVDDISSATLITIPGAGHFVPEDTPLAVADHLSRFLATQGRNSAATRDNPVSRKNEPPSSAADAERE
jgi:pimeloyl-ACP methyl ester carboxylesterase